MQGVRASIRSWRIAALAAIVLCAQAFALIHEVNHDSGNEAGRCATCSIGGGLKHIAAAAEPTVPEAPHTVQQPRAPRVIVAEHGLPAASARAPPAHS